MFKPLATYRLQFSKDFTFRQALEITGYLADLGITTVYASPILQASPGSSHGYDTTDFSSLNPELGTMADLEDLVKGLQQKGITWIQDLVPNHMNFSSHNYRLWDVLKKGQDSPYAFYFDIDWNHPLFGGRLVVPLLDSGLEDTINAGRFQLVLSEEGFALAYKDMHFPLNNASNRFLSIVYFEGGPVDDEQTSLRLEALSHDLSLVQTLLSRQHYLLAPYQRTDKEINYRRFFAINSLIGLRMEDPRVFTEYHRLTLELYDKGWIQGLRIDHIDGLKDPYEYADRLRNTFGSGCYIIAEKILEIKEELPPGLDIQGTSGYEFLSHINQVFTDMSGASTLVQFYEALVPDYSRYDDVIFEKKGAYLRYHMNGEWNNLVRFLLDKELVAGVLAAAVPLKEALGVLIACFPVYRVYIRADGDTGGPAPLDEHGRKWVAQAFREAGGRAPDHFFTLNQLQNLFAAGHARGADRLEFLRRLMQLTGAIAAKGVEDTAFYCYNPLISHNEVGDAPCLLGVSIERFHEKMQERLRRNSLSLNCTSTHDTKRGEDARIRINLISELAGEWISLVRSWQAMNEPFRTTIGRKSAPSANDEYFIYQSIVGGFPENFQNTPLFSRRTKEYMRKALRESGANTTHSAPDEQYETACMTFIDHLFDPGGGFMRSLLPFLQKAGGYAETYTQAMVILKSTAPGIPDFYQGSELWDLNYVDPDNRRPVCFARRQALLHDLQAAAAAGREALRKWLEDTRTEGGMKLFATHTLLHFRKRHPDLFMQGAYLPLPVEGGEKKVLAYARKWQDQWALIIIPMGLGTASPGTPPGAAPAAICRGLRLRLPAEWPSAWMHLFTGELVSTGEGLCLERLMEAYPVAVLDAH
jgi:(1->4)-alpha-D-glucan 1-alpha-D-glucosylmutase